MAQIYSQNPGSTEIQSPLIAGITEALAKISSILNLETKTIEDFQLTPISIDNTEDNKNRIYEASSGNRLWLNDPAPTFKKNGSVITQDTEQFTVDYVGGSITFPEMKKPSDGDKITVSATCIVATSQVIDAINSLLNSVKSDSDRYKGNYESVSALQLAHSSASNGDFAIVFSPLAVYAWKNDGWYDTRSIEDLSNYYQKQEVNDLLAQKEPVINQNGSSTNDDNYYYGGRKTWQDLFSKVRSVTLAGLSTASDAVVTASDTVLSAIGKLQAQVSKATEKAYLSGTGEPTTSTKGVVGQRYVNTSNGDVYTCTATSGSTYTWIREIKKVNNKSAEIGGNVILSPSDIGAATSSQGDKADTAMQPSVYDPQGKSQDVFAYGPHLYKATFTLDGWSGGGPYTQTVAVQAVDGGPSITSSSIMTSGLFIDDAVQGDARDTLQEAASLVDGGTKTFGSNTITCVIQDEKPTADAEVFFNARKGVS